MNTNRCQNNDCNARKIHKEGYCKKHYFIYYVETLNNENKKPCGNYKKGCENSIINYGLFKKCTECFKIDIIKKENKIRRKRPEPITDKEKIKDFCTEQNIDNIQNEIVIFCNKCFNGFPKQYYIVKGEEKIICMICRNRNIRK
jgi:hypothetical protein